MTEKFVQLLTRYLGLPRGFSLLNFSRNRETQEKNGFFDIERFWESFLSGAESVLHVGASSGQEAEFYAGCGLDVVFVEALREPFEELTTAIRKFPSQKAIQALVSDEGGKTVDFFVAENDGMSSSIFPFSEAGKEAFPGLRMSRTERLETTTLDQIFSDGTPVPNIWVVDVQGSEYEVLVGGEESLRDCQAIRIEVSAPPVYEGGKSMDTVREYLGKHGLTPVFWPDSRPFHGDVLFFRTRNQ